MTANRTSSTFPRRLSALDASYLNNESASAPLHVGVVLIFEGYIAFDAIMRSLEQRIHLLPCYRQRLAEAPFNLAHPTLEDDPEFRLENHVKRFRLPSGIDERQAIRHVLRDYRPRLDRSRPLWEFLSFEGWPGGKTLVVSKIHHALVDGLASEKLMKRLFDLQPDASPPRPPAEPWTPTPLPSPECRFNSATREMIVNQLGALSDIMIQPFQAPWELAERNRRLLEGIGKIAGPPGRQIVPTPWNAGTMSDVRDLAWFRASVSDYRLIRNAFGGTTNDVVLTVLAEGAGRYLKDHDYPTHGWFRIASPVNVRQSGEPSDFGNRVSMMFPTIPAAPMDPVERIRAVHQETERVTPDELRTLDRLGLRWTGSFGSDPNTGFPNGVFTSTSLNAMTPPNLAALTSRIELLRMDASAAFKRVTDWRPRPGNLLTRPPEISFVSTYVPSVSAPVYLCGHRCLEQVGVLPVGGNLGYGVAILSYNHNRYIGMAAEPTLMPDIDRMKEHVRAAFEELKRAADKQHPTETRGKRAASPPVPASRSIQAPNAVPSPRADVH